MCPYNDKLCGSKGIVNSKDYSFRIRLTISPRSRLQVDETAWTIDSPLSESHLLVGSLEEKPIKESRELVVRGGGWLSSEAASTAGMIHMDALMLAFTRLRIGADFGGRKGTSTFTKFGLEILEQQSGMKVLNDSHGVLVFESEPPSRFASIGSSTLVSVMQADRVAKALSFAIQNRPAISESERLSLDLFHSSFFQPSNDIRFLVLVMAVEALLDPEPRPSAVASYIHRWSQEIEESESIAAEEKSSLLGSLKWLYNESINRAGRKLAIQRLGNRKYSDRNAASFFSYCYGLRSSLVHGESPRPTIQEVGRAAAQLEVFVSDLLSGPLLGVDF